MEATYLAKAQSLANATGMAIQVWRSRPDLTGTVFRIRVGGTHSLVARLVENRWEVTTHARRDNSSFCYSTDQEFENAQEQLLEPIIGSALEVLLRGQPAPLPMSVSSGPKVKASLVATFWQKIQDALSGLFVVPQRSAKIEVSVAEPRATGTRLSHVRQRPEVDTAQLRKAQKQLDAEKARQEETQRQLQEGIVRLHRAQQELEVEKAQRSAAQRELEEREARLSDGQRLWQEETVRLRTAQQELEVEKARRAAAQRELEEREARLSEGQRQLETENARLADIQRRIQDGYRQPGEALRRLPEAQRAGLLDTKIQDEARGPWRSSLKVLAGLLARFGRSKLATAWAAPILLVGERTKLDPYPNVQQNGPLRNEPEEAEEVIRERLKYIKELSELAKEHAQTVPMSSWKRERSTIVKSQPEVASTPRRRQGGETSVRHSSSQPLSAPHRGDT
jgi:hypothetical protein